jgi:hypothetical protein
VEYNWKEIKEYRKKEMEAAVELMGDMIKGKESPEYFRGIVNMFNRILLLPGELCQEEEKDFITNMIAAEWAQVEMDVLRKAVRL